MERERRCEGSGQRREWEGGDCVFGRLGKKGKSVFIHPLLLHSSASSFFFPFGYFSLLPFPFWRLLCSLLCLYSPNSFCLFLSLFFFCEKKFVFFFSYLGMHWIIPVLVLLLQILWSSGGKRHRYRIRKGHDTNDSFFLTP